tara:strand:- start:281 stop:532 length:252 start_codon:yes stop_codon:yes gene_type:complete
LNLKQFNESDNIVLSGKDVNKIIVMIRMLMDLNPELNESLMNFYCYLNDLKSINEDKSLDEIIWDLGLNLPSWDDELPNGESQ